MKPWESLLRLHVYDYQIMYMVTRDLVCPICEKKLNCSFGRDSIFCENKCFIINYSRSYNKQKDGRAIMNDLNTISFFSDEIFYNPKTIVPHELIKQKIDFYLENERYVAEILERR